MSRSTKKMRKKTPARKKPAKRAAPASPPQSPTPSGHDSRAYWEAKARRALSAGEAARAEEALDRALPPSSDEAEAATRLRWLLRHWPRRALAEINAVGVEVPWVSEALGATALSWGEGVVEGLPHPRWVEDAAALREANVAISEGRDEEAIAALRRIKRDSPLLDAQRFLRGLLLVYQGQDPALLLRPLLSRPGWAAPAAALLKRAGVEVELDAAATRCANPSYWSSLGSLNGIIEAIRNQKANRILVEFANIVNTIDNNTKEMLWNELIQLFDYFRGNHSATIKKLSKLSEFDHLHEIKIGISILSQDKDSYREFFFLLDQLLSTVNFSKKEKAFISYYKSVHLLSIHRRLSTNSIMIFFDDPLNSGEILEFMTKHAEDAVKNDPNCIRYWLNLVDVYKSGRDKAAIARVIERFVKRHPDEPKALIVAAQAALVRKAYDKGLRYCQRIVEIEPLNRDLADLHIELLRGKALKRLLSEELDSAHQLLLEAQRVPHARARAALRVAAELDVFLHQKSTYEAQKVAKKALSEHQKPWLYGLLKLIYSYEVGKKIKGFANLHVPYSKSSANAQELDEMSRELDNFSGTSDEIELFLFECFLTSFENFQSWKSAMILIDKCEIHSINLSKKEKNQVIDSITSLITRFNHPIELVVLYHEVTKLFKMRKKQITSFYRIIAEKMSFNDLLDQFRNSPLKNANSRFFPVLREARQYFFFDKEEEM
ncbi:hypothetical protein KJ940_20570 [Myxococcota bacterium]|nr:hypothetical protein [Myxococcota bacterium]